MSRAHVRLAHRTVRYHSAVAPRSSSVRVGLMVPPHPFVWALSGHKICSGVIRTQDLFGRYPDTRSLDLKILRRRFSAVAYNLELDLLAVIERGQTRFLHSRNVHKHILAAALRLDESIAFGRIKPLHSPGRHQSSPRGKRGGPPNLHIPVTAAIRILHVTNGLVTLIEANLRDQLAAPRPKHVNFCWSCCRATGSCCTGRSAGVSIAAMRSFTACCTFS